MAEWNREGQSSGDTGPLMHEVRPVPRILAWSRHRTWGNNGQMVLSMRPPV